MLGVRQRRLRQVHLNEDKALSIKHDAVPIMTFNSRSYNKQNAPATGPGLNFLLPYHSH